MLLPYGSRELVRVQVVDICLIALVLTSGLVGKVVRSVSE